MKQVINNRKKLVDLQRLSYTPQNLVNFGPETAKTGWGVLPTRLNFRIGRHFQLYRMDII